MATVHDLAVVRAKQRPADATLILEVWVVGDGTVAYESEMRGQADVRPSWARANFAKVCEEYGAALRRIEGGGRNRRGKVTPRHKRRR